MEQNLAQKERELEMREIDLVARELHILIFASNMSANQPPQPNKRKGIYIISIVQFKAADTKPAARRLHYTLERGAAALRASNAYHQEHSDSLHARN